MRKNQRHACGTGERSDVLRNRPPEVVELYVVLVTFAKPLGPIGFGTRERYVLLRSQRIFADVVILSDAIRPAIHLAGKPEHRLFFTIVSDRKQVTHVVKLHKMQKLDSLEPYLREAA